MFKEFILKQIGTEAIWNFILRNTKFTDEENPGEHYIQMAFNRIPELRTWFKAREIMLLKSLMLGDKSSDFVKGQIFEVKLIQRFDVPNTTPLSKVEGEAVPNIPDKVDFLNKWNPKQNEKKESNKSKK